MTDTEKTNTGDRNTGDWNTGDWNTGNRNTGDRNTGFWNTGDRNAGNLNTGNRNTGDRNTGDWNTGDRNTGWFNTTTPDTANYFNAPARISDWYGAEKPGWIFQPKPTTWVPDSDMSNSEKLENPTFNTCGGYLRVNDMADEWAKAYAAASPAEIQMVRDLPNFDAAIFEEITGLDLSDSKPETCAGKIVEIDGKKYRLEEL